MNPALLEASLAPDEKGNASRYHFRESEGASRLVTDVARRTLQSA